MTGPSPTRCPVCAARTIGPTTRRLVDGRFGARVFPLGCRSCGLLMQRQSTPALARAIRRHLSGRFFQAGPYAPFGMDLYTLRIAASALLLAAEPVDRVQAGWLAHPHALAAARARLVPLDARPRTSVALGFLCRPDSVAACLHEAARHRHWASETILLCDGPPGPVALPDGLRARIAERPLDGDFAAQRNALQQLAQSDWMLQLDADESLSPQTGAALPALAAMAGDAGHVSIGLPRQNHVNDQMSDLYPDTQYRLNRRDIRFHGIVHERPVRHWQRSTISLHGSIRHHLDAAHVTSRSQVYEALHPGHGRLHEMADLLKPFAP